jgi:hypothetical protein
MNNESGTNNAEAVATNSNDIAIQYAILTGGVEGEETLMTCQPGDEICVFKTILSDDFFKFDGEVLGTGVAYLEFSKEEKDVFGNRLLRQRRLEDSDVDFAGKYPLQLSFAVLKSEPQGVIGAAQDTVEG